MIGYIDRIELNEKKQSIATITVADFDKGMAFKTTIKLRDKFYREGDIFYADFKIRLEKIRPAKDLTAEKIKEINKKFEDLRRKE